MEGLTDINIRGYKEMVSPYKLKADTQMLLEEHTPKSVIHNRKAIEDILAGRDGRFLIITGPCSIHNPTEALEYAEWLRALSKKVSDNFLLVMRAYFEKPRTNLGWSGLIYDPNIDDSLELEKGLYTARKLSIQLANMGLPLATEFLDFVTPQYLDDLISWAAIGARTSESQPHRKMASGLSMPVGFKNNTSGDIDSAVNAVKTALQPHLFLGTNEHARLCIVQTNGNPYSHIVMRGGNGKPNYNEELVNKTCQKLRQEGLPGAIIIDCSHGNSNKDYRLQPQVFKEVMRQKHSGNAVIKGVMLESYLEEGSQPIPQNPRDIKPRTSITDGCISKETTEQIILEEYLLS